jgi:hypothetical protein
MSLKTNRYGASVRNGLTPGGKTNRSMTNLGNKTINAAANSNQKPQYTDSGQNYRDANNSKVSGLQVDEGRISPVVRKSPERPHVVASPGALKNQGGITEKLYLDGKPEMKAMKRGEKLIPAKKAPTMRGEKFIPAKKAMKTAGKLTPAKKGKPTAQAIVIDMSKKKSKT